MAKLFWFLIKAGLLVAAAVWIADRPGEVRLRWLGYEITTQIGFLILAVLVFAGLIAWLYFWWRKTLEAPKRIGRALEESRRRRGYEALTQGLVAIAAGDGSDAQRWAKKAEQLKIDPPLTLLLSAQAAQAAGDVPAAKSRFQAMLNEPGTKFLGLRGLAMLSLKEGDEAAALGYVEEAFRLKPETPWVLDTLFDLAEKQGRLDVALGALRTAEKRKALPQAETERRRALLRLEEAEIFERDGNLAQALAAARDAYRALPAFAPAAVIAARLYAASGKAKEAERVLERAWALSPHSLLASAYLQGVTPSESLARAKKLCGAHPKDRESLLLLAQLAMEAKENGEAKHLLDQAELAAGSADERLYLLQAKLAEVSLAGSLDAQRLKQKALQADAPPTWSCRACGHRPLEWRPRCPTCGTFDSLTWQPGAKRPSQAAGQVAVTPATPAPALAALSPPKDDKPASPGETEPTLSPEEAARRTP